MLTDLCRLHLKRSAGTVAIFGSLCSRGRDHTSRWSLHRALLLLGMALCLGTSSGCNGLGSPAIGRVDLTDRITIDPLPVAPAGTYGVTVSEVHGDYAAVYAVDDLPRQVVIDDQGVMHMWDSSSVGLSQWTSAGPFKGIRYPDYTQGLSETVAYDPGTTLELSSSTLGGVTFTLIATG